MKKYTDVRRKNREVSNEEWIKEVLRSAPFAAIAVAKAEQPYINANLFIYKEEEHCIYFHTAGSGFTKEIISQNPLVCFSVFEMGRLLPGKKAVDFSTEYSSVVVFGKAEIVHDLAVAADILSQYFVKYSPHLKMGTDFTPYSEEDVRRTTLYRIQISEWSGKQNKQPDDYADAFVYKAR